MVKKSNNKILGRISLASKGFGFVIPLNKSKEEEIFIPKHKTLGAADKDIVEVKILSWGNKTQGPDGEVTKIVERHSSQLVATILSKKKDFYLGYISTLGIKRHAEIKSKTALLKDNDRVLIEVDDWGEEDSNIKGSLVKIFGSFSDASIDIDVAVHEFDIRNDFPKQVIDDAEQLKKDLIHNMQEEKTSRLDLTKETCITIDPTTAKDFDDAISLTKDKNGHFHLGVHIADVAHFVKAGSSLDEEAIKRANSTYFPRQCVPMLPKALSNGLCSLRPNEPKLCVSVFMDFDKQGKLIDHKIVRSVIESKHRFTYEDAYSIISKKTKSPYYKLLKDCTDLCNLLKKARFKRGSIDFALPDAVLQVDDKGEPLGIKIVEYDISHQLIEEFMLKANEVVAKDLSKKKKKLIYRIHEEPAEETFQDFYLFASILGFKLPKKPTHLDIQNLFLKAKDTPFLHQLSINFIRSMKMAFYSPENIGHYGLALEHYCHFTSPIRRYSDLVVQRLLFNEENGKRDLNEIAKICSEKERNSFKAESSVITLKKMRLLKKMMQTRKSFKATITKIKPYHVIFDINELFLSGSLHVSELGDDYYLYDAKKMRLSGEWTNGSYSYGDEITVSPKMINFAFFDIIWQLVQTKKGTSKTKAKKKNSKTKIKPKTKKTKSKRRKK